MWKKLFGSVQPVYSGINDAACLQCRTGLYDQVQEISGLLTFNREPKYPPSKLKEKLAKRFFSTLFKNSIKDCLTKNLNMEHRLRVKR